MESKEISWTDKKRLFLKAKEREDKYGCSTAMAVNINGKDLMVVMTTKYHAYLINAKRKLFKLSWAEWKKATKQNPKEANFCVWDTKVLEILDSLKKEVLEKSLERAKVKRKPYIKRTPVRREI